MQLRKWVSPVLVSGVAFGATQPSEAGWNPFGKKTAECCQPSVPCQADPPKNKKKSCFSGDEPPQAAVVDVIPFRPVTDRAERLPAPAPIIPAPASSPIIPAPINPAPVVPAVPNFVPAAIPPAPTTCTPLSSVLSPASDDARVQRILDEMNDMRLAIEQLKQGPASTANRSATNNPRF